MNALLAPRASVAPFVDLEFLHDPYPAYRALREAGPIHWSEEFFGGAWLLTRHADVEAALRDPRLSARRTGGWVMRAAEPDARTELTPMQRLFTRCLPFLDAPDHTRLRKVLQPAFRPDRVQALKLVTQALIDELLDEAGESFDFMQKVARPLPARVIARLMDMEASVYAEFTAWSEDIAAFLGSVNPTQADVRAAQRSVVALAGYFERELLPRRRRQPGDDLVSLLLAAQADGSVEDGAELLAQCAMLLFAGYETTRHLLGNAVHALLSEREQWERLRAQPELLPNAVRELLRHDTPVQWSGRRVMTDFTLHGQWIRRGELVIALMGAANRDPRRHEAPDQLDVARVNPGALSFGTGPHVCLGAALTQLESQTVLATLLQRRPKLQMRAGAQRTRSPLYRGFTYLPVGG
ncbi:cytochrome P450 [Azohydromonas lata]|uniref:Cytochrome P450 n=1 Tax=Azohydromonas lata TaxID=45677 RepID=A0ABU5IPA6_9BURK|nr:cytochrome P450 [Azohydromonas lata]MDZ5460732.1 cytochrome P450 [Azohydromonas lata]